MKTYTPPPVPKAEAAYYERHNMDQLRAVLQKHRPEDVSHIDQIYATLPEGRQYHAIKKLCQKYNYEEYQRPLPYLEYLDRQERGEGKPEEGKLRFEAAQAARQAELESKSQAR